MEFSCANCLCQLPNDFGRIEEPVAIVFPELDVVCEVFRYAIADRVDIDYASGTRHQARLVRKAETLHYDWTLSMLELIASI
jgi:hypothetical protein